MNVNFVIGHDADEPAGTWTTTELKNSRRKLPFS